MRREAENRRTGNAENINLARNNQRRLRAASGNSLAGCTAGAIFLDIATKQREYRRQMVENTHPVFEGMPRIPVVVTRRYVSHNIIYQMVAALFGAAWNITENSIFQCVLASNVIAEYAVL